MVSGEWTGTMNLTEPQAGSDLAAVRTRAEPTGDGRYKLDGSEDLHHLRRARSRPSNIVHMVLARTPGAPEGVKGISLFLVPKYLVQADGSLGARNDVRCLSVEHKLGIHASPTCVLAYGQNGGAIGELIGEENRGLEYMFIMMNAARYAVGLEGIGLSERAFQSALTLRAASASRGPRPGMRGGHACPIVRHPDVRRMLMLHEVADRGDAGARRRGRRRRWMPPGCIPTRRAARRHQAFADLMIPVVKGWCTENSVEIASLGVQVHGGMGFIEETGLAQQLRDARITPIYEGTTGIQANDLIGRKLARDRRPALRRLSSREMRELHGALAKAPSPRRRRRRCSRTPSTRSSARSATWSPTTTTDVRSVAVGAVPLLKLFGIVAGRMAAVALGADRAAAPRRSRSRRACRAAFYERENCRPRASMRDHVLAQAAGAGASPSCRAPRARSPSGVLVADLEWTGAIRIASFA